MKLCFLLWGGVADWPGPVLLLIGSDFCRGSVWKRARVILRAAPALIYSKCALKTAP